MKKSLGYFIALIQIILMIQFTVGQSAWGQLSNATSTAANQVTQSALLNDIKTKLNATLTVSPTGGVATSAKQDSQTTLFSSMDSNLFDLRLGINADGASPGGYGFLLSGYDGTNTQYVKTNSAGELIIIASGTGTVSPTGGVALDATVSAMSAKLPSSLGIKTAANSLSTAPASDAVYVVSAPTGVSLTSPVQIASGQSVTANAGTNLNTSLLATESGGNLASIKTNTDNLGLSLGSSTSGQKGNLGLAAVTTSAPSYTTAQTNALSMDVLGNLRVVATSSGTGTINLPALASTSTKQSDGSQKTQIVDGSGNVIAATSNALNVSVASGTVLGTGSNVVGSIANTAFTANAGTNLNTSALNLETTQTAMSAKLPASLGIKTAANSFSTAPASDAIYVVSAPTGVSLTSPVQIASGQSVAVTNAGTFSTQVSSGVTAIGSGSALIGSVSGTQLSKIADNTPALGAATSANSSPVTIASNQAAYLISSDMTKVGGAALSLGQATTPNSIPVVLPSDRTVSATISSGTVAIGSGSALMGHIIADTGSTTAVTGVVTTSGTATIVPTSGALFPATSETTKVIGGMYAVPTALANNALTTYVSPNMEPHKAVKASAGRVFSVCVNNTKATSQTIMLWNSTTVPANGVSATTPWDVPPSGTYCMDFGLMGEYFSTGISIGNSTTQIAHTSGVSDTIFKVFYQ